MDRQLATPLTTQFNTLWQRHGRALIALICLAVWLSASPLLLAAPADDAMVLTSETIDETSVNWNEAIE